MSEFMNTIMILLINILDVYIIYRFVSIFFHNRVIDKRMAYVAYMIQYVASAMVTMIFPYPFAYLLEFILGIFLITQCYQSSISKKLIAVIMIYMCMFVSEAVVASIMGLADFDMLGKTQTGDVFINILVQIILWMMTVAFARFKNMKADIAVPWYFTVAVLIVCGISMLMEVLIFMQKDINETVAVTSLLAVLLLNAIMVYLYDSVSLILQEKVSAELVKQEREFYHNQSLLLQSNSEENAKFRHDIRNHLLALEGMVQDGKTDKAITYIKSLTDTKNQVRVYSQTENIAIDSIINYKLSKAEEDGIKVLSNIAIPRDVQIPEDDMVVILGNLLDNAVEAASRVKENAYIKLSLEYDRGCMYMSVKNSFDNIVDIKEGKMQTRKVDKAAHGIGLKSVQLALDKYHGQLDIEYEKNEFDVTGMLYLN